MVTIQSGWNSHPLLLKGELVQPRQKTLWQNCFNIKLNNYPVSPQFHSWVLLALKACPNKDLYKNVVAAVLKVATNRKQPRYPATQDKLGILQQRGEEKTETNAGVDATRYCRRANY